MIPSGFRQRLSVRLGASFLLLSVGALVLATYASYRSAESALRERLIEHLNVVATHDADLLTSWLERHRQSVRVLAQLQSTLRAARGDPSPFARFVATLDRSVFSVTEVEVLGVPGGRVLYSTVEGRVGEYRVAQLYYMEGRTADFTQPIHPGAVDGRPTLTVASPIRDDDGTTLAVLAAHLDLTEMERVIKQRQAAVPMDAYLISPLAEFVSAARFGRPEHRRGVHSMAIDSALQKSSGTGLYRDYAGRAVVGAWRWLPNHRLALILESPQDAAFAPARALLVRSLVVGLLASLVLLVGVVSITRRLTAPLRSISAAAERVAQGDFTATATVSSEDEVGALGESFNAMTSRLRTVYGELADQVQATRAALTEAHASRALLQDVVDNTPTLVLAVDEEDGVRLANARLASLLGVAPERLPGARLAELSGALPTALATLVRDAREADAPTEREIEIGIGGDDDRHTWQCVAFPLRDASRADFGIGVVATDLSERARLEADRRARDASVQQAQKLESLGIMAGGIAHDFNNLLGAILGNVDLATDALDDPRAVGESLQQIETAARRAAELARQMLAYAGRASLRRETVDLREVLRDIVPLVRTSQPKRIEFVVEGMEMALWVDSDPAQLSQVVLNLVTNAAEAIGDVPGRVLVRAALGPPPPIDDHEPSAAHTGPWICLTVEDTGAGIELDVQGRIFEPFFTTKANGRGLGLSAVRGIIHSTGGLLRLTSAPGHGARFDVYLPAAAAPVGALRPVQPPPVTPRRDTVLVVDDEASLRRVMRRTLEAAGYRVVEATDGDEGLRRFREHEAALALVVLDITMPGLNGIELLAEIRQLRPDIPAIIASGYDRPAGSASALNAPRTRFLQKPFNIQLLREAAAELIAEATPRGRSS